MSDPFDLVTFLPRRRRAFRNIVPGALVDRELVSLAHVFAKTAAVMFMLRFWGRLAWQVLT